MIGINYVSSDATLKLLEKLRYPPCKILVFVPSAEERDRFMSITPFYLYAECLVGNCPMIIPCVKDDITNLLDIVDREGLRERYLEIVSERQQRRGSNTTYSTPTLQRTDEYQHP
jgi:hypothetical protein